MLLGVCTVTMFWHAGFSSGRLDSLIGEQPRILGGGACASIPPLKLTVSIAPGELKVS